MDELIGLLSSKVGLDASQAKQVVGVVMGFMKDKLPADVMSQIGTAMPDLGNMLGDAAGAVEGVAGQATGTASGAADAATDAAGGIVDSLKGLFGKG